MTTHKASILALLVIVAFGCHTSKATNASYGSARLRQIDREKVMITYFSPVEPDRRLKCGRPFHSIDDRIVGGKVATIAQFPWIVSIQHEKSSWFGLKSFRHMCGGSLVTPSWIVTAAHCLYNKDGPLKIIAGVDNMNYLYRAQLRSVADKIVHPEFDPASYNNDIALIKVNQPFNLESSFSRVRLICLERNVPVVPYDIAIICGFGSTRFHQKARTHLYSTEIAIVDQRTCNASFSNTITENMICAGGMVAHKRDACSGDSGGPLQLEVDDHISLIGVVSFGNDCALKGYPGVYTNIAKYYDWILSHLDEPLVDP